MFLIVDGEVNGPADAHQKCRETRKPSQIVYRLRFWDTGLNPMQQWQQFEVASAEIGLA